MKKILTSLLVLAMCAPAMAATVAVTSGPGTVTFTITATEFMVGLGLDVTATAPVTAVAVPAAFNIYPDAAYTQQLGDGYTYGEGSPVCDKLVPGQIALPSSSFALCFANLNGATTPGASGAQVVAVTFTGTGGTQVTIAENAIRGGVIGTLGEDVALTGTLTGTIPPIGPTITCDNTYNFTKIINSATDNGLNVTDLNMMITWVNTYKTGTTFAVGGTNPAYTTLVPGKTYTYGDVYNITKKLGGTDTAVNVSDLNAVITFVNTWKTGTTFAVNCATCGC